MTRTETSSHPLEAIQQALREPLIRKVRTLAESVGGKAYLVGGAVRDLMLTGSLPPDLDFTLLHCKADDIAQRLADQEQGHLVPLDWDFGIHRVVFDHGINVDLADALDNSLETDLKRRDLTVNAMALNLASGQIHDPCQGLADLSAKRIRMVSATNLTDDPLRMLRVFRIAAGIQAQEIDYATMEVIQKEGLQVWSASAERIQYEFFRFLSETHCFKYLKKMADCNLLEILIPDLKPMRQIGSSGYHHLGLFDHTLELVRQVERLIDECPVKTKDWVLKPFTPSVTRFGLIKLACLLHDIGKPATMGRKADPVHGERLTFYGHEEVGEQMAEPLLRQWKVSNEVRTYIKKLIRWHLYPCQFGPESLRKSVLRFYRRMGEDTPDVILLALADRHSACGDWLHQADFDASHQAHLWLMDNYTAEESTLTQPRLMNGNEVMQILNLQPGPQLKIILDTMQEARQLGEINSREEASDWLKLHYGSQSYI